MICLNSMSDRIGRISTMLRTLRASTPVESFCDVVTYAQNHGVNNRIAAYMLAIDRVAYTTKQRGIYA